MAAFSTFKPALGSTNYPTLFNGAMDELDSRFPISAANGGTGVANPASATLTRVGNFGLTLTLSGTTSLTLPTAGTLATLGGTETLTGKTLTTPTINGSTLNNLISVAGRVTGAIVAVAASAIDCSAGNYFTKTVAGATSFTFSNVPAGPALYTCQLEVVHTSGAISWPAAVTWPDDTPPVLTTGKTHLFSFSTRDGGTKWRAAYLRNFTT